MPTPPEPPKKPSPDRPTGPSAPPGEPIDLLDLVDEPTDVVELHVDLESPEEPAGQIAFDEEVALPDEWTELSREEPTGTLFADEPARRSPLFADDLEDFATQEELPILPWALDAELLQLGRVVAAVLDPTAARSVWTRPDAEPGELSVTVRLRMLDVPVTLRIARGPVDQLRIGRDVLSGRLLIAVG